MQAVLKVCCKRCQADLSRVRTVSIEHNEPGLLALEIIQSVLMEQVTPEFVISQLPLEPIVVLYSFVKDLQYCIARLAVGSIMPKLTEDLLSNLTQQRLDEHIPTHYESYRFYTTASKTKQSRPEGLHEFFLNC